MDGSVDSVGSSTPIAVPVETPPPQELPEASEREPEPAPVSEDSGKTLDLYV